ncbi:MAG: response regulator, partial [Lachnospiraceae bacterium]|nr:response regulator [Lachnospiraceae bacterium]
YAASGQIKDVSFTAKIYDATNGLPTSDANCVLGAKNGYMWIGGYAGIIRYDGSSFERMDASGGLTSGRALYEDSQGRIWVGTNDNGIVLIGEDDRTSHFNVEQGLPNASIRSICEDDKGNIYIGTSSGLAYIDNKEEIHLFDEEGLSSESVEQMAKASDGSIYGLTYDGRLFYIKNGLVEGIYESRELGLQKVTAVYPDPLDPSKIYLGCNDNKIYYGSFGDNILKLKKISVLPTKNVDLITYACGRIWVSSDDTIGYLDENMEFNPLENLPMTDAIYSIDEDYQGNLWVASARQGVMKIVTTGFNNITKEGGLPDLVVNSTCLRDGLLYVGEDGGLCILDENNKVIENELTKFLADTRIRCITRDHEDNLWISTYTNDKGLICYTPNNKIISYTKEQGMISNATRCTSIRSDGAVMVGTNDGMVILKEGSIERTIGASEKVNNTVFMTIEEGFDGEIFVGTDGDGIYVIKDDNIEKIGRSEGLTSDVILRIKRDDRRKVYWIITSNSIEYLKDGKLECVTTFPYNNNFDIYYSDDDNLWILSSYGIFVINSKDMLENNVKDYKLYTVENGLPGAVTANSFSELDEKGNLYIASRSGVNKVNINTYIEKSSSIILDIKSIYCEDKEIEADSNGRYTIPASNGRIQITPAVLNYALTNPLIRVFLEGDKDAGVTATQSQLTTLEYTNLHYGDYKLHIQVLDETKREVLQDQTFDITKKPLIYELRIFRVLFVMFMAFLAGLIVWRIMTGTIIRRQYEQIRLAKDEAERANQAKTRFLANMSHEIRTPINTIMGMDEMILREDPYGVPKEYHRLVVNHARDIKNASETLLSLINDLLDISKVESGKMHLVEQEYDTEQILRTIVAMIRIRAAEKDLFFNTEIDSSLPRILKGDNGKIRQVVLNLLTNSVKYTKEGGFTLKVLVKERDDESCLLRVSVKDTGIGIKPEDMDKLFSAYERLDEEKNSGIQGTGLGLDISKKFAELMGGSLVCESEYGKGSEFIFTFRQRIVDNEGIGEFAERDEEISDGSYVPKFTAPNARILVVDDNPMNLAVIKGLLKPTKLLVDTAASGKECLKMISEQDYNIVFLDHMMPEMDGIETLEEIKKMDKSFPVYALTANSTAGADFYTSKGFKGYLSKPIDSALLEKTILEDLPKDLIKEGEAFSDVKSRQELPKEYQWLEELEGLNASEGIANSGGVDMFLSSLEMFYDSIKDNSEEIKNAYINEDIRLFTIKV